MKICISIVFVEFWWLKADICMAKLLNIDGEKLKYLYALLRIDIIKHYMKMKLIDFLPFLQGRQIMWLFVCFPAHQTPSEKGCTLKGKNLFPRGGEQIVAFAPRGSKFLLFNGHPFSEGRHIILTVASHEMNQVYLNE